MMLSIFKKRLCPLVSLAIAFGCGKKINDPAPKPAVNNSAQMQELPSTLTLEVNAANSPETSYLLQRNAWFKLPSRLIAKNASAVGKSVKILYNLDSNNHYEFHCLYSSLVQATELTFDKCQTSDDVTIISNADDLEKMDFPMDKGTSIKMQILNQASSKIKIDSSYVVDWK